MRPNFKLFTQKSHFGFEVQMMPKEIYSSLDQLVLGTFLFAHRLHAGLPLAKVAEQGAFKLKRSGLFL